MAIAGFKSKDFSTHRELSAFAAASATTIVAIVFNAASGKYTLFYT